METKSFAYSTTKGTKTPITPQTNTTIVNQETCVSKYQNCGAQYVGYSMRQLREKFIEHRTTYESPVGRHYLARDHFNELIFQILTQAPANEANPELWLK